jgi:glycosyltransferase involved in cell wall biosynthesis
VAKDKKYKIVYCTPALYMAGGVERVLTLKANYFAEQLGYDITIILTEGRNLPLFYPLSNKVKVVNLDLGFEELWHCSFLKKVYLYLKKQRQFKQKLRDELMRIKPDITVSLLRREINFITGIKDGSKKIGELHINRANYRNFDARESNFIKSLFSKFWMRNLVGKLQQLDKLVVLTDKDKASWVELSNVVAIPDPLSFQPSSRSELSHKRVIAVGRYSYEKGYDMLLSAWKKVAQECPGWRLDIFGDGDKSSLEQLIESLNIDRDTCALHGRTADIEKEYVDSSLFVCCSRFEGFGMVIVEAMACGLPVVSFDCPWGPGSIISDGDDGVLVENANVDALADKIIQVLNSEESMQELAKNAIDKSNKYKLESIALKWKSLFESL